MKASAGKFTRENNLGFPHFLFTCGFGNPSVKLSVESPET